MAKKISELDAVTSLAGTEFLPVVSGGVTKKVAASVIAALGGGSGGGGGGGGGGGSTTVSPTVFDYEFGEADNATAIADSGPLALAGILSGGAKVVGGKLSLAAVGDFLTIVHGGAGEFASNDFKLSFKFASSQTQIYTALFGKEGTGGDGSPGAIICLLNTAANDGKIVLYSTEVGSPAFTSTAGGYNDGAEHLCEVERKANTLTLKVDGALQGTMTTKVPFVLSASPLYFGTHTYFPTTRQFIGTFDAIKLTMVPRVAIGGASSGGGGAAYENPIDVPPTTPNAWNDEFEGTLDSAWTPYNATSGGGTLVTDIQAGKLVLRDDALLTVTGHGRLFMKNKPAGDFDIIAKVTFDTFNNYNNCGIGLYNSATDTYYLLRLVNRSGSGFSLTPGNLFGSGLGGMTGSEVNATAFPYGKGYLRMKKVGGSYDFYYSVFGKTWIKILNFGISDSDFDKAGFYYCNFNTAGGAGYLSQAMFDWIRNYT